MSNNIRCLAITLNDTQCERKSEQNSDYCWQHKKILDQNFSNISVVMIPLIGEYLNNKECITMSLVSKIFKIKELYQNHKCDSIIVEPLENMNIESFQPHKTNFIKKINFLYSMIPKLQYLDANLKFFSTFRFQNSNETTAYPRLTVSGGKGAKIRLTYSEALYDKDQHKGDRDDIGNRTALGLSDSFLPDGGAHRVFEPLWWRTWRYLDIDIETGSEPLTLESLTANFTAYPFEQKASFHSSDGDLDKINEISWRTARLDAHETYMDTPYYEQLQYVGDTRIQALISYAVAGDDRLARQAITAFDQSRTADGLTMSRYPSSLPQIIPTFSLLWIGMVHDYWMYRPDPDGFVQAKLQGIRSVLNWYAQYREPKGLLRKTPYWSFVDWVGEKQEIPTYDARGVSCVTSLHYLGALEDAADLERAWATRSSEAATANRLRACALRLAASAGTPQRGLIADNPDQKIFSQQANILAVLYDVIPKDHQQEVLRRMLAIEPGTTPDGVLTASYYFRFYLARALDHAGMADEYLSSLDPWRKLLPLHFSTWPETPGNTRSDSHAWSAHPIYDLLTLVAGIEPASPGFATVRIAPHLGALPALQASFPHPQGMIEVSYERRGSGLSASITLPGKLTGSFVVNGISWPLNPGMNKITIP